MKVIFLDIDGVLNCSSYRREKLIQGDFSVILQQDRIALLRNIVNATGAAIVLISSWRKFWMREGSIDSAGKRIETALESSGLSVWDKTTVLYDGTRSQEIEKWLKCHPYVSHYVILDDNDFAWSKELRRHWVHCSSETGLTAELESIAVDVLRGNLLCDKIATRNEKKGLQRLLQQLLSSFTGKG